MLKVLFRSKLPRAVFHQSVEVVRFFGTIDVPKKPLKFPRSGSSDDVQKWLNENYDATVAELFVKWTPNELLFASEPTLKEKTGQEIGGRLFGALNAIKAQHSK